MGLMEGVEGLGFELPTLVIGVELRSVGQKTKERGEVTRNKPVEVMTGSIVACFVRASMHSSFVMWKIKHFSIICCT